MNWVENVQKLGGIIESENTAHPHCPQEQAHLFQTFSGAGTEIETLWLLWALIRRTKPQMVLETGTLRGVGTFALSSALKENGRGKLISLEMDKDIAIKAYSVFNDSDIAGYFEIINMNSLEFIEKLDTQKTKFDFAFFDSKNNIRPAEFKMLYEKGGLTNLVAFHDTSRLRERTFIVEDEPQDVYVAKLDEIEKKYCRGGLEFTLAKGLRVMQLDKNTNPAFH
jgi:predicted O-methyltransferase YrrM